VWIDRKRSFIDQFDRATINGSILREMFGAVVTYPNRFTWYQDRELQEIVNGQFKTIPISDRLVASMEGHIHENVFDDDFEGFFSLPLGKYHIRMNEPVAIYSVMYYLSSLVRYRPDYLERISASPFSWVIESFVASTPTSFLRYMVNEILNQNIRLAAR
jgi:hypothetical protein